MKYNNRDSKGRFAKRAKSGIRPASNTKMKSMGTLLDMKKDQNKRCPYPIINIKYNGDQKAFFTGAPYNGKPTFLKI